MKYSAARNGLKVWISTIKDIDESHDIRLQQNQVTQVNPSNSRTSYTRLVSVQIVGLLSSLKHRRKITGRLSMKKKDLCGETSEIRKLVE